MVTIVVTSSRQGSRQSLRKNRTCRPVEALRNASTNQSVLSSIQLPGLTCGIPHTLAPE